MTHTDYQIYVIEDDPVQLETLTVAITEHGFGVQGFQDRVSAEQAFARQLPDLVISDIILGSEVDGGFELAKHLLSYESPIPIIFLSERQSEFDVYTGHALGAVDYLPKPITLAVLLAKVKNLLRITAHSGAAQAEAHTSKIQGLELNENQFKAYWHHLPLDLTATEFEMLKQFDLAGERGVVTYENLQAATQGVVERNTINTHICRIRSAFRQVDPDFHLIHNEYGRGYSWYKK